MIKRAFDILVSAILLVIFSPVMLITAAAVFVSMGKPVLFRQQRPGYKGQPFTVLKFRSMREAVDKRGQPLPDSDRLTFSGNMIRRLSLDELPQLLNVLKGDMSLVGPRPLLMEYLPLYTPEQMRRHDVRPGITGWAQVNGRNTVSWEERFKLDLWYVDHHSFGVDLKIIALTARKVIIREGVNQKEGVTMEKFTGSRNS
jgi:lipopolysaccharide/colanic/teichoic acid biosynthesis glycosyltransferase